MIGIILSILVNLYTHYIFGYNVSDSFVSTMAFLVGFYTSCFIMGAIARLVAFRGDTERKKIKSLLNIIGRSWSACILNQSWRDFFATETLFIGASSLLLGSGHFGAPLAEFNSLMFFSGLLMLLAAIVAQRIAIRGFIDEN